MSINTTLSSVNGSSSTSQASKASGSESTKKTTESSFKDEMNKVTTEKETGKTEDTKEVQQKTTDDKKVETSVEDKANVKGTADNKKDDNVGTKENVVINKGGEIKNLELLKNQQLFDKNNLLTKENQLQQGEEIQNPQHQVLIQQEIITDLNEKNKITSNIKQENKIQHKDDLLNDLIVDEENANIALPQQSFEVQNNFNADNHKTEETEMLTGNVLLNNTLSSFDVNNNELSNDIQQMINISSLKSEIATASTVQGVGTMSLNSSNKISMTQSDAEFFVNLTQNNEEVTVQNITAQATEMTKQGAEVKEVEKNVEVSQTLLNALSESREKNQPLRIDFDQNISVILRVNKDGVISANFLPHDKAVEQYLRNNIESLKNSFNENDLPYSDLSYSNRGGKQQKEQQRNRQQQQQ